MMSGSAELTVTTLKVRVDFFPYDGSVECLKMLISKQSIWKSKTHEYHRLPNKRTIGSSGGDGGILACWTGRYVPI